MRVLKKVLSLFICMTMIFASFAISIPQETEAKTLKQVENQLKEYQSLLNKLQSEKASLASEINKIDGQADKTASQLNVYIQKIENLEAEIALTDETMQTYGIKLSGLEADLLIKQENLKYYQDMYASLILYSFKQEDASLFEVLLESENFSDFLTKIDNLKYFLDYTDSVMDSLKIAVNDVDTATANHKNAIDVLDEYNTTLTNRNNELQQTKTTLNNEAAELGTNLSELQKNYVSKNPIIKQTKTKIASLKKEREELLNSDKDYRWPIKSGYNWYVSSWFGPRRDPFGSGRTVLHYGIDIPAASGVPIVASKGGTVTRSEYSGGYGNVVIISHGSGFSTLYAHCSKRVASVGQNVKQGDVIAYVGTTGSSTGNHLHFGVIANGSYVNPDNYLPNCYTKKYYKMP